MTEAWDRTHTLASNVLFVFRVEDLSECCVYESRVFLSLKI